MFDFDKGVFAIGLIHILDIFCNQIAKKHIYYLGNFKKIASILLLEDIFSSY